MKSKELTLICLIKNDQGEVPFPVSLSFLTTGCAASIGQLLLSDILLFISPSLLSFFFSFY